MGESNARRCAVERAVPPQPISVVAFYNPERRSAINIVPVVMMALAITRFRESLD